MKKAYMKPEMEVCEFTQEERLAKCPVNPGHGGDPEHCPQDWGVVQTS